MLLFESVGDDSTFFFILSSTTYFFSAATKSKQKMPLSNAERLTQRKLLVCNTKEGDLLCWMQDDVRCETDLRAVPNGFV